MQPALECCWGEATAFEPANSLAIGSSNVGPPRSLRRKPIRCTKAAALPPHSKIIGNSASKSAMLPLWSAGAKPQLSNPLIRWPLDHPSVDHPDRCVASQFAAQKRRLCRRTPKSPMLPALECWGEATAFEPANPLAIGSSIVDHPDRCVASQFAAQKRRLCRRTPKIIASRWAVPGVF